MVRPKCELVLNKYIHTIIIASVNIKKPYQIYKFLYATLSTFLCIIIGMF